MRFVPLLTTMTSKSRKLWRFSARRQAARGGPPRSVGMAIITDGPGGKISYSSNLPILRRVFGFLQSHRSFGWLALLAYACVASFPHQWVQDVVGAWAAKHSLKS